MNVWEISLAGVITRINYAGETAADVLAMINARNGFLADGVYVNPKAVLAVTKFNGDSVFNTVLLDAADGKAA